MILMHKIPNREILLKF